MQPVQSMQLYSHIGAGCDQDRSSRTRPDRWCPSTLVHSIFPCSPCRPCTLVARVHGAGCEWPSWCDEFFSASVVAWALGVVQGWGMVGAWPRLCCLPGASSTLRGVCAFRGRSLTSPHCSCSSLPALCPLAPCVATFDASAHTVVHTMQNTRQDPPGPSHTPSRDATLLRPDRVSTLCRP